MGLGQKIKEALHHDEPQNQTYESNKPPGAFPSDSTNTKHTNTASTTNTMNDHTSTGRTGHTGTGTGTGLTGNTTAGSVNPTRNTNTVNHGGATGGLTGKSTHQPTDSGIDIGHRKAVNDEYRRTGDRNTNDPYWGSVGSESHGVTGNTGSGLTGSNARTGYDDPSGTHGPHGNRVANQADPRVDSDRDHRGAPGSGLTGSHNVPTGSHNVATGSHNVPTGSHNIPTGYDDPSGTHGPHGNRVANQADPRVDSDRDHRGAPGPGLAGSHNVSTGYDDRSGTHGPHGNRVANQADPRVDSDRDHRGAPGSGLTGSGLNSGINSGVHSGVNSGINSGVHSGVHSGVNTGYGNTSGTRGLTGSNNVRTGYDDPAGTHGPHGNRLANQADPRVDSDRDHRGAPGHGLTGNNKDLPLRPNERPYGSSVDNSRGTGPKAVGGGVYNPNASAGGHHDPTSDVDRSIEGREFTHTGPSGNVGSGAGNQMQYGISNPVDNPTLTGAHANDPNDTRMRDRDMGRDRTGHGIAGGAAGAGLGLAASEAAHRHHHDDIRGSTHGVGNTSGGGLNSSVNTHGGAGGYNDRHRSSLTGSEPGVPKTSMLDPYNSSSPTSHGVGSDGGLVGGRNASPTFNQGGLSSNIPSGMGPDHYGPGHEGAKVMHTCSHCGNDNDISRYFKKEAVYRMN
ncbi:hypothetical protein CTRI78_v010824 [Colletotrichum trifolii]|uniref:Cell surface protein n=1 Tax=Colletotrichum trifolii TaxID=5466 RepID=A0A4R8QHQ4_COLTR|nr:hypothetical protein CTRI78_v010824 [Colletotrichum trifolii]